MSELPEVHCDVCGRLLKAPDARRRGRGRTCDKKVSPTRAGITSSLLTTTRRPASGSTGQLVGQAESLLDQLDEQP